MNHYKITGNLQSQIPLTVPLQLFRAGKDMMYLTSPIALPLPRQLKTRPDPRRRWVGRWQKFETVKALQAYIKQIPATPQPCPLCGKEPVIYGWAGGYLVYCDKGHKHNSTIMWRDWDDAIEQWNAGNTTISRDDE